MFPKHHGAQGTISSAGIVAGATDPRPPTPAPPTPVLSGAADPLLGQMMSDPRGHFGAADPLGQMQISSAQPVVSASSTQRPVIRDVETANRPSASPPAGRTPAPGVAGTSKTELFFTPAAPPAAEEQTLPRDPNDPWGLNASSDQVVLSRGSSSNSTSSQPFFAPLPTLPPTKDVIDAFKDVNVKLVLFMWSG